MTARDILGIAVELPGARALFTTRSGGVSQGAYASLNLGLWTDDDPAAVARNRDRLAAAVGAPIAFVRQIHGARVLTVTQAPADGTGVVGEADGLATASAELAPAVLTADCLPVVLAGGGAVAVLHAGWRGLAAGILAEGVGALRELGAAGPLAAAIGPGAGACCYEVGDEVRAAFAGHGASVRRGRHIDLKAVARAELHGAGVEAVEDVDLCTICGGEERFFSHRRDGGLTGRQAGVAWLS